jgi:uncharacterized protein (DUF433 family)
MPTMINDRARIEGTRITVYDVMTYADAGWHPSSIAAILGISTDQVRAALKYIAEHESTVRANYRATLDRIERGYSPEIEVKRKQSLQRRKDRLKQNCAGNCEGD